MEIKMFYKRLSLKFGINFVQLEMLLFGLMAVAAKKVGGANSNIPLCFMQQLNESEV